MTRPRATLTLAAAAVALASGCASFYLRRAPPSPGEGWRLPVATAAAGDTAASAPQVVPGRVYTLPELIDLAESTHPDTRIAWERARQAALGVGVAMAGYFPIVSALTLVGYQHTSFPAPHLSGSTVGINPFQLLPSVAFPVPRLAEPTGRIGVDTWQVLPFVNLRWELFHLGRAADVQVARDLSTAANALFTAEHERVVFEVARAFFRLNAARAQVAVSHDTLERTRAIAASADARYARGLATAVETSEARRELAQGEYNVAQAQAAEIAARAGLVAAIGLDPKVPLEVAEDASVALPTRLARDVDAYIEAALAARPDLRAARARLPATEAGVWRSKTLYVPRVTLVGTAGGAWLGGRVDGHHLPTLSLPNVTVGLTFDWTLFDGGLREVQGSLARSQQAEAAQQLAKLEHQVVQEVVTAYNEANASLSRYQAATALLDAADTAEAAATASYTRGVATLTDAMTAEKMRALASAAKAQAYADALVAMTTLAFAAGELLSPQAVTARTPVR
ncbi:MAG TPA: TolC family protein [Kofleriaceae bacterium]|nr:TolC family protein [Kofleriaceae bacterium]